MKNKTLIQSIVSQRCPSCRTEKLFSEPTCSKGFHKMHNRCPNCQQEFEPEPGFYTGAMYVSYALQVALIGIVAMIFKIFHVNTSIGLYLGSISVISLLLFVVIYRLSRSIWIHIFVPFRIKSRPESKNL